MLLALHLSKFADSLCKKPPSSMDELRERAKGYIQMKEMFRFCNEVHQVRQKPDKREPTPRPTCTSRIRGISLTRRFEVSPDTVHPYVDSLLGFAGKRVKTRGYVDLMTTFGQGKLSKSFIIIYLLVDTNTSYFSLIGRKTLNELEVRISTPYLTMKFPTLIGEIVTVKVVQKQAR
ncbi:hypothetical protein JHK87_025026 [Glycine soja]|nr:hypothetical protein JHK87_025026 [Glycine soja]